MADTISILLGLYSTPDPRPGDLLRLLSYTAFGAAALHPTMSALSRRSTPRAQTGPSRGRLLVVGLAALIAPTLLALEELLGVEHDSWAIVVGSIVLSALVLARMVVAVEQVEEVNRSRAELQEQLAYDAAHDSLTQLPNRARGLALTRRALAATGEPTPARRCSSSTSTASSTSTTPSATAVATRCSAGSRTACGSRCAATTSPSGTAVTSSWCSSTESARPTSPCRWHAG